jgi:hypothetical protein
VLAALAMSCGGAWADAPTASDINKLKQDPVSGLKTVFFQNVTVPVGGGDADSFSIQPVWPFAVNDDWKLITYTIVPFQFVPSVAPGAAEGSGLGNILFNGFFTPAKSEGSFKWGVGPAVQLPTRTNAALGGTSPAAGPAALVFDTFGDASAGVVVQNLWSLGGSGANQVDLFSVQYFATYNFPNGWYAESNASITADWLAPAGERWTVPVGGGFGKTFQLGERFTSAAIQGFYNVERPTGVGDWMLIAQFQVIFGQ